MVNVNPELADSVMPTAGGAGAARRARRGSTDSRSDWKPFDQNQRLPDVPEIKQEDENVTTATTPATTINATSVHSGNGGGHYFYDPVTGSVQYHNNGSITGDSEDEDNFVDAHVNSHSRQLSRASNESSLHGINNNSSNTIATTATVVPSSIATTTNNNTNRELDEDKMDATHVSLIFLSM